MPRVGRIYNGRRRASLRLRTHITCKHPSPANTHRLQIPIPCKLPSPARTRRLQTPISVRRAPWEVDSVLKPSPANSYPLQAPVACKRPSPANSHLLQTPIRMSTEPLALWNFENFFAIWNSDIFGILKLSAAWNFGALDFVEAWNFEILKLWQWWGSLGRLPGLGPARKKVRFGWVR